MVASPLPNARQQFIDINGEPLVSGEVYLYEVNTLVPKDSWQNAEQTVLNTNPIVLDSRGQATIYGVGAYRQILKDSAGNTIWDKEVTGYQASVFGPQTTLASATITNLGTAGSNNVIITGTTTINSFGTAATLANPTYLIEFSGALQLTYNATSMVLPGGVNITTAAGDWALVEFTNIAGYWRMISYFSQVSGGALGTAAYQNIGTSGANVPLLSGNNTWQNIQYFQFQTFGVVRVLSVVAGSVTPDMSQSNHWDSAISANVTFQNPTNIQSGQSGLFRVLQSNPGLRITWGTAYKAAGGISTVNLSGINNAVDYFAFFAYSASEIVITPLLHIS